jgi:hypothetical protein
MRETTVKQVIGNLHLINLQSRLSKLQGIGAPEIVINNTTQAIENIQNGTFKVNGLARKHKVADVEVSKVEQATGTVKAYDYKGNTYPTVVPTVVLRLILEDGQVFYYDYYSNKIGTPNELDVCGNVESLSYEEVAQIEQNEDTQDTSEEVQQLSRTFPHDVPVSYKSENLKRLGIYERFRLITRGKVDGIQEHQQGVIEIAGNYLYNECYIRINSIEEREDSYHITYSPIGTDSGRCRWGCCTIYKNRTPEYGVVGLEHLTHDFKVNNPRKKLAEAWY